MGLRFNVGNSRWLRGNRVTYVIVGIAVVVMLGLLSVGGYALFSKLSHSSEPPPPTSTRVAATATRTVPAPTSTVTVVRPTPTLVIARPAGAETAPARETLAAATVAPTAMIAQVTPIPSKTPAPPTVAPPTATQSAGEQATMAVPNTGMGLIPAALTAFGCLAAVSVARAARRRK